MSDASAPSPPPSRDRRAPRFVREGLFLAHPLSFPSVSEPVPAEESALSAVACCPGGQRYVGGTAGPRVRLVQASFLPPTGYVFDLGVVPEATETVRLEVRGRRLFAAVNGPFGGRLVTLWLSHSPDGIQEWHFHRPALRTAIEAPDAPLLDAWLCPEGRHFLGLTAAGPVAAELPPWPLEPARRRTTNGAEDAPRTAASLPEPVTARPLAGPADGPAAVPAFGRTDAAGVWLCRGSALQRLAPDGEVIAGPSPAAEFGEGAWGFTALPGGRLLAARADGTLLELNPAAGTATPRGAAPLAPVRCLAGLPDGRAYGFAGTGVGRWFVLEPGAESPRDLGAVAAVVGWKRYGLEFADAAAGCQGEICLAEADRGGHLWLYLPPLAPAPA